MAKYYVTWKVEGRYTAEVDAESISEAREKSYEAFENADFGELHDIGDCDTRIIIVEDKNDIVWEAD